MVYKPHRKRYYTKFDEILIILKDKQYFTLPTAFLIRE